jgi:hypothetical protein
MARMSWTTLGLLYHLDEVVADGNMPLVIVSLIYRRAAQCLACGGWLPAIAA